MRSETQMYELLLGFAQNDERIRLVTLEGSRTNIHIPRDDFQDYDITFFVTDMQSFINSNNWLNVFGERVILQKPEDMELFPAVEKVSQGIPEVTKSTPPSGICGRICSAVTFLISECIT